MEMTVTQSPPPEPKPQAPAVQDPTQPPPEQAQVQQPAPQSPPEQQPPEQSPEQQQPDTITDDKAVNKFVQDAGFDPVALSKQIATAGDIPAEAKKTLGEKLEKAGLPASMIDEYISGQKAVMQAGVQEIMSVAGGEQGWQEMADWARQSLTDAELNAFSNIMTTADMNTAKLTVGNMYARYRQAVPASGKRLKGATSPGPGDIYHSFEQQKEAQRDPRYRTDPAFREEVSRKVERTLKAGGYR